MKGTGADASDPQSLPADPDTPRAALDRFGYSAQLSRALSTRDLIVYGMIFMSPTSPFVVYGFVWQDARGMVALAYLLGMAGMLFTAMSYATMSRAFPLAGSVYAYAQRGLHPIAGFFAGWLILLDYILLPALTYVFSAVALQPLLPGVPEGLWLLAFIGCNALINVRGVQLSARINRWLLAAQFVVLACSVAAGVRALHAGQGAGGLTLAPLYDSGAFSPALVASGASLAVLSFLGFDGISTLAEENRGPRDAVGRATVLSLLLIGALFILQSWVAADLSRGVRFQSPATAFYEISARAGGAGLRLVMVLTTVISGGIASAMAAQAAIASMLFAMARDGRLPAVLARIHPRYRTPHIGTLFVAAVSLVVGLLSAHRVDDLTRIVNFGALCGFLLLHLSVIHHCFIRGRSGAWLRHLLCPLAGGAVIGCVLYAMDGTAKRLGICWILIGAVYLLAQSLALRRADASHA